MPQADLIVRGADTWITMDNGDQPGARAGAAMNQVQPQQGLALAIQGERIAAIGPEAEILDAYEKAEQVCDLKGGLALPGFIDPHTHPVFNATRELEFELRNQGKSYVEIAQAGGGIRSSVRSLREASEELLTQQVIERAQGFLKLGTTTIEAKSGYGLSTESELRSLRAIKNANESAACALELIPTFLGAHEIPDEYREDREAYLKLLEDEMIPQVAKEGLAQFCDVFCEEHVFTREESRRILSAAKAHGLKPRVHADEIESTGGAEMAAEVGACSADHLGAVSTQGIQDMKAAGVIPILLPGTSFFLDLPHRAPGRELIDAGLAVSLATDYNPGSCHTQSLPMIMTMACIHYGWTAAEALTAVTVNAAASLGLAEDRGMLRVGMRADIIGVQAKNLQYLPYHFGDNLVSTVIKNGRVIPA